MFKFVSMIVTLLKPGEKPTQKFNAIPGTVRSFCFSTSKFHIEATFHTAVFYAPEFYKVTAKTKSGTTIWSGGENVFLDSFFNEEFISDTYSKLILQRIGDTGKPESGQIILIDLNTGKEKELGERGAHSHSGHFQSFDGVFYSNAGRTNCLNFETGKEFQLKPILDNHFSSLKTWWPSPVRNCIVVLSTATENNLILFDLLKQEIKERTTVLLQTADNINLSFKTHPAKPILQLTADYAKRSAEGILQYIKSDHFIIEF